MSYPIPEGALSILQHLRGNGHRALLAGGCVRDLLMGRTPKDYDVATDATPERVMGLFPHTAAVGAHFGVVLVMQNGRPFEVATFRKDHGYADGRHPDSVSFTDEAEDARRRDFTVNGLMYDPLEDRVLDYVEGRADIERRVLRAIGDPVARFKEDHLRILRALRFAADLDFGLDAQTEQAVKDLAPLSVEVSAERLRDELIKMLTQAPGDRAIEGMRATGVLRHVLPEVEAMIGVEQPPEFHPEGDVYRHTLLTLKHLPSPSPTLALGALLHDVGKPQTFQVKDRIRFDGHVELGARLAEAILRRLRAPNDVVERVAELVRQHLRFKDARSMRESTLKRFLRMDHFDEHLQLHRADCLASHGDLDIYEFCRQKLESYGREEIRPPRLVTGDDLIELGLTPGPAFKDILEEVETAQLEGKLQSRDDAIAFLRREVLPRHPQQDPPRP
ncbi:MAG: CCA tRNA nucleotidyltransferase [Nitrospirae bacterium]|nr:CCA tRNA nucleotidyltransferase [Nitrospirota bacterium]